MKATIKSVRFVKEYEGRYGMMYLHAVKYNDKEGLYSSKSKDQKKFVPGQEAEFTEVVKTNKRGEDYVTIKPFHPNTGNFGRQLKREQSKYSGFAMSYAKDLVIADRIKLEDMPKYTKSMFNLMVELDKTLES